MKSFYGKNVLVEIDKTDFNKSKIKLDVDWYKANHCNEKCIDTILKLFMFNCGFEIFVSLKA
jgi:hypothetical protein